MTTDSTPLKPCPFCGGPAEHDSGHYIGQVSKTGLLLCGHAIYCADTGCIGCPVHSVVWTEEDGGFEAAAEAWNTRDRPADSGLAGEFEKRVSAWREIPFDTIDYGMVERAANELANFCEENLSAILAALTPATTDNDALVERLEFELRDWNGDRMAMELVSLKLIAEAATAIRHLSAREARLRETGRVPVDAIDQMIEDTNPIFAELELARGRKYEGKKIGPELEAFRKALAQAIRKEAE